jgi:hypothetical protein
MEIVADPNWQVKQALLENLKIEESKMSALFMILSYLISESHTRVRAQAERILLLLGTTACEDTTLKEQRKKLEKRFRSQLLEAVQSNKDIDVKWLGIEQKKPDPMDEIMKKVSLAFDAEEAIETPNSTPEGVSLSDFSKDKQSPADEEIKEEEKSVLLSALLGAKKKAITDSSEKEKESKLLLLDPTIPAPSRFILVMQGISETLGKDVPIDVLSSKCIEAGLTVEEFDKAFHELEKQGIVYRSREGTVSYVDIEE